MKYLVFLHVILIDFKNRVFFFIYHFYFFLADVFKIVPFAFFLPINGVFALSEVDCGFKQRLPQTKDLKKVLFVPSLLSK
jgi:hypothetical protein